MRSASRTRAGSSSNRTCCQTPTGGPPPTSARTASTWPPRVLTPVAALRLGLAGAGRMGRNHLRAIAGSAVVKGTAIAEPVASTRSLLQGADSALYGSLDDMLDTAPIDAVLVCVPSDLHLTTTQRLADAHLPP